MEIYAKYDTLRVLRDFDLSLLREGEKPLLLAIHGKIEVTKAHGRTIVLDAEHSSLKKEVDTIFSLCERERNTVYLLLSYKRAKLFYWDGEQVIVIYHRNLCGVAAMFETIISYIR